MHCRPFKVNNFAVLSLLHHLAIKEVKKNQYSLLFVYLLKTKKRGIFDSEKG